MTQSKIKYCSADFLIYYKSKFESEFLPLYLSEDKKTLESLFNETVVIKGDLDFNFQSIFNVDDFEDNKTYMIKNIKIIHSTLSELTRTQATKEELWFTMIHTYFLDYLMSYVKSIKNKKNVSQLIKNAIFFNHGNVRSLVVNDIARYWWIGERTYDENCVDNHYWLTEYFTEADAKGKAIAFFSSKFTNNREIALGIIEGVKEVAQGGKIRNRKETYSYVNEHFNYVGGVRVLDIMTRDQIRRETLQVLEDLVSGRSYLDPSKKKLIICPN